MAARPVVEVTIELTPAGCLSRRGYRGKHSLAEILGVRVHHGQVTHVYLDRLIHRGANENCSGFTAQGAVSTVLIPDVPIALEAIKQRMGGETCRWLTQLI